MDWSIRIEDVSVSMVYREKKMLIRDLFPRDVKLVRCRSSAFRFTETTRYNTKQLCQKNRETLPNISILRRKKPQLLILYSCQFFVNGK